MWYFFFICLTSILCVSMHACVHVCVYKGKRVFVSIYVHTMHITAPLFMSCISFGLCFFQYDYEYSLSYLLFTISLWQHVCVWCLFNTVHSLSTLPRPPAEIHWSHVWWRWRVTCGHTPTARNHTESEGRASVIRYRLVIDDDPCGKQADVDLYRAWRYGCV